MEIEVTHETKTELEFIIKEKDPILGEVLSEFLNKEKDVDFAAYRWDHPLAGYPRVFIRAKDPRKALFNAINKAKKEIQALRKGLKL